MLDSDRLAAARNEVRTNLAELGSTLELDANRAELEAFAELFDLNTLALRRGDWPVRRIVEGALSAEDPVVAGAAARYLGLRGSSSSARHLRRALDREDIAPRAARALVDLGDSGLESLAYALELPELREVAVRGLVKIGNAEAARALAASFESSGDGDVPRDETLLAALNHEGLNHEVFNGLESLVDLRARGVIDPLQFDDAIAEIADAGEWFALQLEQRFVEDASSVLLGARSLAPEAAAEWVERNLHEPHHRQLTRKMLPTLPGPATVASLIRLNDDARLNSADLSAMTELALQFDAQRFVDAAATREPGTLEARETLIEMLLASGSDAALPVMLTSITDDELSESARTACALRISESSNIDALPVLTQVFGACNLSERKLAAACLLGIARIGGDEALTTALEGGPRRVNQNILSLLQRREAGERATPSIYKLARELRPFLSARDRETRRTSS